MHAAGLSLEETLLVATARRAPSSAGSADRRGRDRARLRLRRHPARREPADLSLFDRRGSVSGVFKGGRPVVTHPRFAGAELVTA